MFEIILFVVVGSIIYSVIQSVRRGDVGPEERKQNPTLLESVSELAEEAARNASKYRSQTEFELTYCEWFRRFEITVSKALESAEEKAKRESELNADPQLRKRFDEITQNFPPQPEKPESKIDSSWVNEGPPPEPPRNSDPELDALFRRIYWDRNERHKKFVQNVRDKLTREPICREFFAKYLRDLNLGQILSRYFLTDDVLQRVAAAPRNSAARDIASEALNMARSVDAPDKRTRALLKVAEGQAQIGELSSARATIAEALEATQEDPSEWLSQLDKVAKVQISLGDVSEALETAERIVDPSSQGKVLVEISNVQASLGDISGAQITALAALREARKIAPVEDRCRALREVATALAMAEDGPTARIAINEALGATKEIEESKRTVLIRYSRSARAAAMADVAKVQAAIGDISGAVRTARSIEDLGQKQKALVQLVETLAKAGNVSRAQEIARSIQVAGERCWALAHVATALAEAGDLSEARGTASEALETAREIDDSSHSLRALVEIVEKLFKAGDLTGALETARSIRGAEARCRALASVAFEQARTGDQSGAKRTASEALVAARCVDPIDSIPGALGQVARAHAEAGESAKALLIARGIGSAAHRSYVLAKIAKTQLRVGDKTDAKSTIHEALEAARSPHGDFQFLRTESLSRVAELQVMTGDAGALQTARGAGNAVQVAYALERIAKATAAEGHLAQAVEIALGIEDVEKRSSAMISVAVADDSRSKSAAFKCGDTAEPTVRQPNRKPATSSPPDAINNRKWHNHPTSTGREPNRQLDKDAIAGIIEARKIGHLIHFTQAENLSSIFRAGIVSVEEAKSRGISMKKNDSHRFDGYLNAISMSVSYPNAKMFYKLRQINKKKSWALLFVDPAVLYEKRCGFCRYNAADKRIPKGSEGALVGSERFSNIFDRSLLSEDRHLLRPCDPTDPQAEVLVFEPIGFTLIRRVVFFDRNDMALYGDVVQGTERCVDNSWLDSRHSFLKKQPRSFERPWQKSNVIVPDDEIPF